MIVDCSRGSFLDRICWRCRLFWSYPLTNTSLTSSVHDSQHDGGDPGHLTGCGIEDGFYIFEEHSDGFGEGIRETNGDEGTHHYYPAPATFRGGVARRPTQSRRHVCSRGGEKWMIAVSRTTAIPNLRETQSRSRWKSTDFKTHNIFNTPEVGCRKKKKTTVQKDVKCLRTNDFWEPIAVEVKESIFPLTVVTVQAWRTSSPRIYEDLTMRIMPKNVLFQVFFVWTRRQKDDVNLSLWVTTFHCNSRTQTTPSFYVKFLRSNSP